MARSDPSVNNLSWCESQVVVRAILPNGTTLRLGTATLSNIPEEDSLQYSYEGKIMKDSSVRISTTQSANQASLDAENVDKQLGLTINDVSSTLLGAKIVCSKVFANPLDINPIHMNPELWYAGRTIKDVRPNTIFPSLTDLSGNGRDAVGSGLFTYRGINGHNTVTFNSSTSMNVVDSFPLAQVFVVFNSPTPTFSASGSILGSANTAFKFAGGTSQFAGPLPSAVRKNGIALSSPYDLGDITKTTILTIYTNSPNDVRSYFLNSQDGVKMNLNVAEVIGFYPALSDRDTQKIEAFLHDTYGQILPYTPDRGWDRKVLLVGEISGVDIDENIASIKIVSDIAPNVAFIASRSVSTHCPLVFKGVACGYSGPLTTCNKVYISDGGCSGRSNQHRFGGVVITGELPTIVSGGIDTGIGVPGRYPIGGGDAGGGYLPWQRNREV